MKAEAMVGIRLWLMLSALCMTEQDSLKGTNRQTKQQLTNYRTKNTKWTSVEPNCQLFNNSYQPNNSIKLNPKLNNNRNARHWPILNHSINNKQSKWKNAMFFITWPSLKAMILSAQKSKHILNQEVYSKLSMRSGMSMRKKIVNRGILWRVEVKIERKERVQGLRVAARGWDKK